LQKIPGVLSAKASLRTGEVTVQAKRGKVKADQLIEAVGKAHDSSHSFKAKLKKGPE
jgi:copper chaperone CopZ